MGKITLALLAASLAVGPVGASSDDPYAFMSAVASALSWMKTGMDKANQTVQSKEPSDGLTERVRFLKQAQKDYERAVVELKPHVKSKDPMIRENADLLLKSLLGVWMTNAHMIELMVETYDPPPTYKLGEAMNRLTDAQVDSEEAWRDIAQAVPLVLYSVVDLPKEGEKPSGRLRITTAQRNALRAGLDGTFGCSSRTDRKGDADALLFAACLAYDFLGKQEWKSSDETRGQ